MADVKDDVKPTPQTEDIPTPQISGEAPDKVSDKLADQAVDLSAILSHPDFEALLDKKVQSVKDVRFGKLGTEVKDSFKMDDEIEYIVKIDKVIKLRDNIYVLDYKTSTAKSSRYIGGRLMLFVCPINYA